MTKEQVFQIAHRWQFFFLPVMLLNNFSILVTFTFLIYCAAFVYDKKLKGNKNSLQLFKYHSPGAFELNVLLLDSEVVKGIVLCSK